LVTKQASGSAKIDPLMAAFNAIALRVTKPQLSRQAYFVGQHPLGSRALCAGGRCGRRVIRHQDLL